MFARSLAAALVLVAAGPATALACGGLFCSVPPTPTAPEPVDQSAERIVFTVDSEAQTTTAHVQIQYAGGASAFAWVVPVPSVPVFEESTQDLFTSLDDNTRMQVVLPTGEPCAFASGSASGFGCSDSQAGATGASLENAGRDAKSPVTIYAQDVTDNFEFAVVGAAKTADLIDWLQVNAYNVSDNMTPVMDVYNGPTAKFLALKLRDGKTVRDIVPISMTYEGTTPMIPIQLTAVAAQPLMGILVYILADTTYVPDNFEAIDPDTSEILFDGDGTTSYFEWVARVADEAEGKLFVREYVGPNPLQNAILDGDLRLDQPVLSRFYTRMSAHHMTVDPVFVADESAPQRVAALDFTNATTLWSCGSVIDERLPSPCAFNYCGRGAACAVVEGLVGCDCAEGDVAQPITGPDGSDRVTCVPRENPFGITAEAGGAGSAFDPCASYACGAGACVLKGGFPTCACQPGTVACLEGGAVSCMVPLGGSTTFGPGAGSESAGQQASAAPASGQPQFAAPLWAPVLAALGVLVLIRRRTRVSG